MNLGAQCFVIDVVTKMTQNEHRCQIKFYNFSSSKYKQKLSFSLTHVTKSRTNASLTTMLLIKFHITFAEKSAYENPNQNNVDSHYIQRHHSVNRHCLLHLNE